MEMAQLNPGYHSNLIIANPKVDDASFFESCIRSQESECNNLSCTKIVRYDELKCNITAILNLKKNLESLRNLFLQCDMKDDQFKEQKQCSNDLKVQMEFLLDGMKNYKSSFPSPKKAVSVSKKSKKSKKRNLNYNKIESGKMKSFIKNQSIKKKPTSFFKNGAKNLCENGNTRLSELNLRKADAQKFLNLLQDMIALRKVKVANARTKGEAYSDETNAAIEKVIDGIKQQWMTLMAEYTVEERMLKEKIKDENQMNNAAYTAQLHYWEKILFGNDISNIPTDNLEPNFTICYALMRCMWDECINQTEGSNVPLGWVMPEEPSSTLWEEYCQKERS